MKKYVYSANDFTGGINTKRPEYHIDDNELVQMINCTFDTPGIIKSRNGFTKYNSSAISGATEVKWCWRFYDKDGTTTATLVGVEGASSDELYLGTDATGAFSKITTGSALTKGSRYTSVAWKDTLFITNGVEAVQLWQTGTTSADITGTPTPPTGKYIELHTERLFLAGNSTYPSRLYYCGTGDETDWASNNYMDVDEDDGGIICGLAELGQVLMVFKSNGVHRVWGNSLNTFERKKAGGLPGCIAPRSIAKGMSGGGVMWLAREGVAFYDGANFQWLKNENIESIIDGIDGASLDEVYGFYADSKYYLAFPDSESYNDTVLVYDFYAKGWYKFSGMNIASMMWWNGQDDDGEVYFGDANGGYLYKMYDGYTDNGSAIPVTIEFKHIDGGSNLVKHWKDIYILALNKDTDEDLTLTPIINVDQTQTTATVLADLSDYWGDGGYWGSGYWGGGGIKKSRHRIVNASSKSNYLGLQLTWSSDAQQLIIRGFEVHYNILSPKR